MRRKVDPRKLVQAQPVKKIVTDPMVRCTTCRARHPLSEMEVITRIPGIIDRTEFLCPKHRS